MDRNGKKAKKPLPDASENTERSDTKASAHETAAAQHDKGRQSVPPRPASPGRKGNRG